MEKCNCSLDKRFVDLVEKYSIPFKCGECGSLKFGYNALRDVVFIFPLKLVAGVLYHPYKAPEKIGSVIIPESIRHATESEYGIVLSVGPGYWDKKKKKLKFIPTLSKVGDIVIYDKDVPWIHWFQTPEGKKCKVKYMGQGDIKATIIN